ncbi:MAG: hypothetical protein IPL61_25240 [Myxococcales bacterium]|nr:hypothetical protein [Myxococcales bacterium]
MAGPMVAMWPVVLKTISTLLVLVLSAHGATAAPGDLAVGAAQLDLLPRRDLMSEDATGPYWHAAAFAQVTAGSASGPDVGVGAAAAVSGIGCDVVSGSVQGRVRPLEEQRAVASAQWGLCLSRVLMTFEMSGVHELGVAPALDRRQSIWRRRYDADYERIVVGVGELWRNDIRHRHAIAMVTIGHGTIAQHDDLGARAITQLDLDVTFYWYHYAGAALDAKLEVLAVGASGLKSGTDDHGGVASTFAPLRASLDGGSWFASAHGGWGMTGGTLSASSETKVDGEVVDGWAETIDGAGLPELIIPVGQATLGVRHGGWSASASVGRAVYPTFDSNVAAEERASARLDGAIGKTTVALAPFATRTRTWTRDAGSSVGRALGASATAGRPLTDALRLDVYGELGVSPYARLDGDRAPVATLGGQVLVALTARVER